MERATRERWQRILAAFMIMALVVVAVRVGSSDSATVEFSESGEWLETGTNGSLVLASAATGEVVSRAPVGDAEDSLESVTFDGSAIVLNRNASKVSLLSGSSQEITRSIDTDVGGRELDLLATDDEAYLLEPTRVRVLDPATLAVLRTVELDAFPDQHLVDDDGDLWMFETERRLLHRLDDGNLSTRRLDDESTIIKSGAEVVLVSIDNDQVILAEPNGAVIASCELDGLEAPLRAASDGSRSIVVSAAGGTVLALEHVAPDCGLRSDIDGEREIDALAGDDGVAYIGDNAKGTVVTFDMARGETIREVTIGAGTTDFDLFDVNGVIWANEPMGVRAAVLDGGSLLHSINKLEFRPAVLGATAEAGDDAAVTAAEDAVVGLVNSLDEAAGQGDVPENAGEEISDPDSGEVEPAVPDGELRADFAFSASVVQVGESVTFSDRSSGAPVTFAWDFGDGELGSGREVTHSWADEGEFTVTLTVDDGNASDSAETTISVVNDQSSAPPVADFSVSSSRVEIGERVTLTDRSSGSPSTFAWDFDDGSTGSGSVVTKAWNAPGIYSVSLTVANVYGSHTTSRSVEVVAGAAPPGVTIVHAPRSLSAAEPGVFRATTSGNPTNVTWQFGDGTSAEGESVSHAWLRTGTFTVTVTASNSRGSASDSTTVTVGTVQSPVARMEVSATNVDLGETVTMFSTSLNSPTSLTWDFGDGTTASGPNASHAYQSDGQFVITLTVQNSSGVSSADTLITVNPAPDPPVANFGFTPTNPRVGVPVVFQDRSLNSPTEWAWDFGNGATSGVQNPTTTYDSPGTYQVILVASNASGSHQVTVPLTVAEPAPEANFDYAPKPVIAGQLVTFTDLSGGAPTAWAWDFGDGATSGVQNPTHTFGSAGTYQVTLTASTVGGSDSRTISVLVRPRAPVADFNFSPNNAQSPVTVNFVDASTGTVNGRTWTFHDGTTATGVNASKNYATAGEYPVTLTVRNGTGENSKTKIVKVLGPPAPTASFTISPSAPHYVGQPVTFTSTSSGDITALQWTLNPGGQRSGQSVTRTYNAPGTKSITLVAVGPGGASQPYTQTINVVHFPPDVTLSVSPLQPQVNQQVTITATSIGGPITSWAWNLGNGGSSNNPSSVVTSYANSGQKTVTVTVSGPGGGPVSRAITFNVVDPPPPPPTASFTFAPASPQVGQQVQFTNQSTNADTYLWDFGDGFTSNAANPVHPFATATTYTVRLTVWGPGGGPVSTTRQITVSPPPP